MKKWCTYLFAIGTLSAAAQAPAEQQQGYTVVGTLSTESFNSIWYYDGTDTLGMATYAPVVISAQTGNARKKKEFDRLQKKVIKVYPYAHAAGQIMKEYEAICKQITDTKEQKRLLDQAEDELKKQFENDLRSMTVSEGVILIKLIDRETGDSSYGLVQELKGKFSAFMWQSVARLFGHNLKDEYDPYGKDVWIENVVLMIQDGTIPVQFKEVDPFGLRGYSMRK
jgi:hypothetical protein